MKKLFPIFLFLIYLIAFTKICYAPTSVGGGIPTSPGGENKQIQFNDNGQFEGSDRVQYESEFGQIYFYSNEEVPKYSYIFQDLGDLVIYSNEGGIVLQGLEIDMNHKLSVQEAIEQVQPYIYNRFRSPLGIGDKFAPDAGPPVYPSELLEVDGNAKICGEVRVDTIADTNGDNTSSLTQIANAVSNSHTQNTDTSTNAPKFTFSGSTKQDSEIEIKVVSKPSAPVSNYMKVYPKSDKSLYLQDENGTETPLSHDLTKIVILKPIAEGTDLTTGDSQIMFVIPQEFNGMKLVSVGGHVFTASSSGTPTIQVYNNTDTVDMLSTAITIDENEKDSCTAGTPSVIDQANNSVSVGEEIRVDVDVSGNAKGLEIRLGFKLL